MQKWKVVCEGEVVAELQNRACAMKFAKYWHKINGKEYKVVKPGR